MKRSKNKRNNIKIWFVLLIMLVFLVVFIYTKPNTNVETIELSTDKNTIKEKEKTFNETSSFPTDVYGVPVYTELIDSNTEARPGIKRRIKYIVIHETDNFESRVGARNHARFLKENNTIATSWHYTVDDTEIYHHIPDNEIAYHAADKIGNEYRIGVELCVNQDGNFNKTFQNGAKLVAYLLKEYDLTINDIKTHNDFSGKDCPHSILKKNRMGEFKNKVKLVQSGGIYE